MDTLRLARDLCLNNGGIPAHTTELNVFTFPVGSAVHVGNSSVHSPSALLLTFQLVGQLSKTRFEGYYSDSSSLNS